MENQPGSEKAVNDFMSLGSQKRKGVKKAVKGERFFQMQANDRMIIMYTLLQLHSHFTQKYIIENLGRGEFKNQPHKLVLRLISFKRKAKPKQSKTNKQKHLIG